VLVVLAASPIRIIEICIIAGAGGNRPGIVLDRHDSQSNRKPIVLLAKVYCKVDASYSSIDVGDLLITSDTPGHAMKAADQSKALGAVIGKAFRQGEHSFQALDCDFTL
jgi:hypothetical protein